VELGMSNDEIAVNGLMLQQDPKIYMAAIPGRWLLKCTTPSWRIDNPDIGFQRVVREERAREIALAVLDQGRTFPNAIILATNINEFSISAEGTKINIPTNIKFLVVDGQHRLWAQNFSTFEAVYGCIIHMGLTEVEMARLFLEINDNQKRVPSSLRWDLIRLVRPNDDLSSIAAAELVYLLATEQESPLFQRIDLTGEQKEIELKQGSVAPAIKSLLTSRSPFSKLSFEQQYQLLLQYLISLKECDSGEIGSEESAFFKARVLRALFRLLPDIIIEISKKPTKSLRYDDFIPFLKKIDITLLGHEKLVSHQGSAGMKAIYDSMSKQVFGRESK